MDLRPAADAKSPTHVEFDLERGSLTWVAPAVSPALEDILVNTAFRELMVDGIINDRGARDLGRAMATNARASDMRGCLAAFSHLGVGYLHVKGEENGRYTFESRDLLGAQKAGSHTCALALGFLEGLVRAARAREALGAETRCRARGDPACTFVVMAR